MEINVPPASPRELVLVAKPDAKLRVVGDKVISIGGAADVTPLMDLVSAGRVAVWPLYGVSEEWLKQRTALLDVETGSERPLDLSLFYKVTAPDNTLEDIAALLRNMRFVQSAYVKPGVELPIIDNSLEFAHGIAPGAVTGDFTPLQVYLNAASDGGVGARCAWDKPGGGGDGVNIIDIEGAWNFGHEDLGKNQDGLVGGVEIVDSGWRNHGTAVLGVIGGDRNTLGVTGICPEAKVRTVSIFGNPGGGPVKNWGPSAAIFHAADMLGKGDIILIEHHLPGPPTFKKNNAQVGYIPVEWWPCNMAAIQYATAKGIFVVEAAGNGRRNLDLPTYDKNPDPPHGPFPPEWSNPFKKGSIDTKAIFVGAGAPPEGISNSQIPDRSRMEFSNFGSRLDVQGWGDQVVTSGYGGFPITIPNEKQWYTRRFWGTSSAAAMVAGVVGALQGFLRAGGISLSPGELRELLRDDSLNSPQAQGPSGSPVEKFHIGPRPDLCKLIAHLSQPDGLARESNASIRTKVGRLLRRLIGA